MLGMGDKKRLAMIIIGKPKGEEAPASSSSEDFVQKAEGDKQESVSESATAGEDAMAAFMSALDAKDKTKAVAAFKSLMSCCGEDDSNEEDMMGED